MCKKYVFSPYLQPLYEKHLPLLPQQPGKETPVTFARAAKERNTCHFCHSSQGKKHLSLLPHQSGKETPAILPQQLRKKMPVTFATAARERNTCHFCHSNQKKKRLSLLPQQLWKLPFPSTTSLLFALWSVNASPLFSTALSGTSSGLCPACGLWPSKVQGCPHRSETSPKPTNLAHDAKPTNQSCR